MELKEEDHVLEPRFDPFLVSKVDQEWVFVHEPSHETHYGGLKIDVIIIYQF